MNHWVNLPSQQKVRIEIRSIPGEKLPAGTKRSRENVTKWGKSVRLLRSYRTGPSNYLNVNTCYSSTQGKKTPEGNSEDHQGCHWILGPWGQDCINLDFKLSGVLEVQSSSWQNGTHCREKFSIGNALPNCGVIVTPQWVQRAESLRGSERQSMELKRIILAS